MTADKLQQKMQKWIGRTALLLSAGIFSAQPVLAQDAAALTPHQQLARDIYSDLIAFRTARGQE